ncbi:MAG TPA: rod shape-determining protein MreC [Longimicrobiales bacterium]|nr:rod shape-determining protein MreC [Longimicrobiales bacterium]
MLDFDGSRKARRRDMMVAGAIVLFALILFALPAAYQRPLRNVVRGSVLAPFLSAQATMAYRRSTTVDVHELRAQRDSLVALVSAEATLAEENRKLRGLLSLRARAGSDFVPAEVIHLGLTGSESTFLINIGSRQGVKVNSPILAPEGLVGIVIEVQENAAQAIDWTHPEFRVSAMTVDGESYGIVEARRGTYREEDLLALTGAPFHTDLQPGTPIVTSGRGTVYPRGIPLGVILGIEEADTGWRKSYLIRPAIRPEAVTHVLVGLNAGAGDDLAKLWNNTVGEPQFLPDSARARPAAPQRDTTRRAGAAGTQ